jgi:hypothetical protein
VDSNVAEEFVARISTPAVEMGTAGLFETSLKHLPEYNVTSSGRMTRKFEIRSCIHLALHKFHVGM